MENKQSGVTLIEIATALFSLFLLASTLIFAFIFKSQKIDKQDAAKISSPVKEIEVKQDLSSCSYVGTSRSGNQVFQCDDNKFFEVK